jgi:hypothetical protein
MATHFVRKNHLLGRYPVLVLRIRIRVLFNPGIRGLFNPWIRDPGWVKSHDPDPGSGMNNPDHIS